MKLHFTFISLLVFYLADLHQQTFEASLEDGGQRTKDKEDQCQPGDICQYSPWDGPRHRECPCTKDNKDELIEESVKLVGENLYV